MFGTYTGGSYVGWDIEFNNSDKIDIHYYDGSGYVFRRKTTAVYRDTSAWYHIVVAVDTTQSTASDRLKLYVNGVQVTAFDITTNVSQDYETNINTAVEHRIGYNYSYSDFYLADIHFVDAQALAPTDFGEYDSNSVWQPKAFGGTYGTNGFHLDFSDTSSNSALGTDSSGAGNNWSVNNLVASAASVNAIAVDGNDKVAFPGVTIGTGDFTAECFFNQTGSTSGVQRIFSHTYLDSGDIFVIRLIDGGISMYLGGNYYANSTVLSGWHHAAIVRSGSTVSFYLDGTRRGTATNSGNITFANVNVGWGNSSEYFIGEAHGCRITKEALYSGASYTVPTSAITTTSQGATASNVVHLSATTSTVTTNSGTTANGTASGDPTAVIGSPFGDPADIDALRDSPVNGDSANDTGAGGEITGNYAVINPLGQSSNTPTISDGNLQMTLGAVQGTRLGTIGVSSGKYYFEVVFTASSVFDGMVGVASEQQQFTLGGYTGAYAYSWGYYYTGEKYNGGGSSYGASYGLNDVIGVAIDMDNQALYFSKNGVYQNSGDPTSGSSKTGAAFTNLSGTIFPCLNGYGGTQVVNFGARVFNTAAPSGYKCLNTANLSDPLIADGSTAFDAKLWTGNGTSQTITGFGFSPSFAWFKSRSGTDYHALIDSVRGKTKVLFSNTNSAEETRTEGVSSFNSDGFSLGDYAPLNKNNDSIVGWSWSAGENSNKTYAVTVSNPGSGNKYYVDGALQPTLTLAEGSTYKFDQSSGTNSTHPLRFSTTSDGTHGGGSEYTTGVTTSGTPGSAGAYTQIVIAASAPTLYAYCTAHSGMGFQINTSDTAGYTIPVGGSNSAVYDQSQTWSTLV